MPAKKKVVEKETEECPECEGAGTVECGQCSGNGQNYLECDLGHEHEEDCEACDGSGEEDCDFCRGTGELKKAED